MAKLIVELEPGTVISDFQENDILLYNETKGYFYRTTASLFFNQYEKKLIELRKAYDEKVKELTESNAKLEKTIEEQTSQVSNYKEEINTELKEHKAKMNDLISKMQLEIYTFKQQIQENQAKQISMIEAVLKGEEQ